MGANLDVLKFQISPRVKHPRGWGMAISSKTTMLTFNAAPYARGVLLSKILHLSPFFTQSYTEFIPLAVYAPLMAYS